MMSAGLALRALFAADAAISAVIGALPNTRVWPITLPQAPVLPAATYFEVSAVRPHSSQQGPLKLSGSRIQVDAWALSYAAAMDLAEKIRKRIDGYKGVVSYGSDSPQATVTIQGVFLDSSRDLYESEPKQFRISRDYIVWFEEAIS